MRLIISNDAMQLSIVQISRLRLAELMNADIFDQALCGADECSCN